MDSDRWTVAVFESLYRRHVASVFDFFVRRVAVDVGEELTAQTFVEAWACRHSFEPDRGSERAWLHGIASNLLRRHFRREQRQFRAYDVAATRVGAPVAAVDEDVSDRLVAGGSWPEVVEVLARMSATDREVLLLTARADLTYEAIAVVLQVPVGTVRSRLSRARTRLAAHLADVCPRGSYG